MKPSELQTHGRVRVLDFGLARAADRDDDEPMRADDDLEPEEPPLEVRLTQTGALVGTVAYMALEQLMGTPASPASDQFSFCVSLYEALHGSRPFAGQGLGSLTQSLRLERVEPAPRGSGVPARLRRALLRGLSAKPAERWPSMDALLAELSRVGSPRVRGAMVLVGVSGVLGLVAGAAFLSEREDEPCRQPRAALEDAWSSRDRAAVDAAFATLDEASAGSLPLRVQGQFDAYAAGWVEMYEQSCRATFVLRQQSERMFDQRMRCLERRRNRMRSAIDALVSAPTPQALVERTVLPFKLPELAPCADVEALAAEQPLPDDEAERARVEQVRQRIDEADTLYEAGEFSRGLEVAMEALEQARELGYRPVLAEALASLGRLQTVAAMPGLAEGTLEEAVLVASQTGDDRTAATAWTFLLFDLGQQHRRDEAFTLELAARAAVERAHDEVARGWLLNNLGVLHGQSGHPDRACELLREALEVKQQTLGPAHVDVGISWFNLGNALINRKSNDEAIEAFEHARSIFEATVGGQHPLTHSALFGLCRIEVELRRPQAVELCREARSRIEALPPAPEWPSFAGLQLAQALWNAGAEQEALDVARRAKVMAVDSTMAWEIERWLSNPAMFQEWLYAVPSDPPR